MIEAVKMTAADVQRLHDLSVETYTATFDGITTDANMVDYLASAYNLNQLRGELLNPESTFYLALVDGEIAGYLKVNVGTAQSEPMGATELEAERIYIRTRFQKRGLGHFLIETAEADARAQGKASIWLGVWEHNENAQQFYAKHGFVRFSEHAFVMGDDVQTDFLLRKMLK